MQKMKLTKNDLKKILEQEPTLFAPGLHSSGFSQYKVDFREFKACCKWLSRFKRVKVPQISSYYLKHIVESLHDGYVSNGALIAAAIHLDIPMKLFPDWINTYIAISRTCPYLKERNKNHERNKSR